MPTLPILEKKGWCVCQQFNYIFFISSWIRGSFFIRSTTLTVAQSPGSGGALSKSEKMSWAYFLHQKLEMWRAFWRKWEVRMLSCVMGNVVSATLAARPVLGATTRGTCLFCFGPFFFLKTFDNWFDFYPFVGKLETSCQHTTDISSPLKLIWQTCYSQPVSHLHAELERYPHGLTFLAILALSLLSTNSWGHICLFSWLLRCLPVVSRSVGFVFFSWKQMLWTKMTPWER